MLATVPYVVSPVANSFVVGGLVLFGLVLIFNFHLWDLRPALHSAMWI